MTSQHEVAVLFSQRSRKAYAAEAAARGETYTFTDAWGKPRTWLKGQYAYLATSGARVLLSRCNIKHDLIEEDDLTEQRLDCRWRDRDHRLAHGGRCGGSGRRDRPDQGRKDDPLRQASPQAFLAAHQRPPSAVDLGPRDRSSGRWWRCNRGDRCDWHRHRTPRRPQFRCSGVIPNGTQESRRFNPQRS